MKAGRHALAAAAAAAMAATGCAYFNGMYYANHYTRQAMASERAGRISEAHDRWQQAAMHADSVIAHHAQSRWTGEAMLVRGRALVHLEAYADAVTVLQEGARRAGSPEQHLEELGLMGRAYLARGMLDAAGPVLDSATEARRQEVRDQALLDRGRLLVALGRPDLARGDLGRSRDPRAPYELAQVDLMVGDTASAGALYDSLVGAKGYGEADWLTGLDSLASAGAGEHASRLVDSLVARPGLSAGARARLMLDDATRRLRDADTAGATREFQRVVFVARDSVPGQAAAVALCRLAIAEAAADSALAPLRGRLAELVRSGGGTGREAQTALRLMARLDTLASAPVAADAFWFLRAELLRDSLHAGRLARAAFAAMVEMFPSSPWTPKAIVAAIAGGHPDAESLRVVLAQRYGRSPYAMAALGEGAAGDTAYAALEDSLRQVLAVSAARRVPAGGAPRRPGEVGDVDEEVNGRRRPASGVPAPGPPGQQQPARPRQPAPPQ